MCYDGKRRNLFKQSCAHCLKAFYVPKNRNVRCCSRLCKDQLRRNRTEIVCAYCGKIGTRSPSKKKNSSTGLYFCDRKCKDHAQRLEGLKAIHPGHYGKASYNRAQLIRQRGHRCDICKNTEWCGKPIPLEVDHINGDSACSDGYNLRLICPNCHAQTPTYRGGNRGYGREAIRACVKGHLTALQAVEPGSVTPQVHQSEFQRTF